MPLRSRIVIPIIAALLLGGTLIAYLSLQINVPAKRRQLSNLMAFTRDLEFDGSSDAFTSGDEALTRLRQGDLSALRGEWAEAEAQYEEAVKEDAGLPALRKLAQAQLQRRKLDALRDTLEKLKRAGAREEDLLLLDSIVMLRTGEVQKAETVLIQAAESPQKHYGLSLLRIIQGNHDEARSELAQVLAGWEPVLRSYAKSLQAAYDEYALFPQSPEIHLQTLLARSLADVAECELALPLLTQVLASQDDYRDAWVVQGYCELVTERSSQALSSLERAYTLDPEKPEIQYFLARAYAAQGDHNNAVTFLQFAVTNGFSPEEEARRLLAIEAVQARRTDVAFEQYNILSAEENADLATFDQFIAIAIVTGHLDEAEDAASKALIRFPEEALAHEILGSVFVAQGKNEEAKAAFEKALQLDPGLESAREKMKGL